MLAMANDAKYSAEIWSGLVLRAHLTFNGQLLLRMGLLRRVLITFWLPGVTLSSPQPLTQCPVSLSTATRYFHHTGAHALHLAEQLRSKSLLCPVSPKFLPSFSGPDSRIRTSPSCIVIPTPLRPSEEEIAAVIAAHNQAPASPTRARLWHRCAKLY